MSFLCGGCVYEASGALGRGGLSGPLTSGRVVFTTDFSFSFSSAIVGSEFVAQIRRVVFALGSESAYGACDRQWLFALART